jgi:hypothetical protein
MICKICGSQVPDNSIVCPICGTRIQNINQRENSNQGYGNQNTNQRVNSNQGYGNPNMNQRGNSNQGYGKPNMNHRANSNQVYGNPNMNQRVKSNQDFINGGNYNNNPYKPNFNPNIVQNDGNNTVKANNHNFIYVLGGLFVVAVIIVIICIFAFKNGSSQGLNGTWEGQELGITETITFSGTDKINMEAFGLNIEGTYSISGNTMTVTYNLLGYSNSVDYTYSFNGDTLTIAGTEFTRK